MTPALRTDKVVIRDLWAYRVYLQTMSRDLYLIAYDVCDHRRLARVHHFLKGYSTGGQKSVYECFLTHAEVAIVERTLRSLIDDHEDRVYLLGMDGRSRTHTLGLALQPKDPAYFYFG